MWLQKPRSLVLDNTYIEKVIITLFLIDINGIIKNKVAILKNFHTNPNFIEDMPMWEYELFMRELNEQIKDDNDKQKDEISKYNLDKYQKMNDPNSMMRAQQQAFKAPSFSGIKPPKF